MATICAREVVENALFSLFEGLPCDLIFVVFSAKIFLWALKRC